jgi:hypothetical protein
LGGFPERARRLIGASITEPVLHICGGNAHLYPYAGGYGQWDERQDLDAAVNPEHFFDCSISLPHKPIADSGQEWGGMIADPPYSEQDATHYAPGADKYPKPNKIVELAMEVLPVGRKVGIIHYIVPKCPKNAKFVACVGIVSGFNNRIRAFSVFEKTHEIES